MAKKLYNLLYAFQGIACMLVTILHIHFPGDFGIAFSAISKWCVPMFFMVSGFFLYDRLDSPNFSAIMKRKMKHILIVTLLAVVLSILINILSDIGNTVSYLKRFLSLSDWALLLGFNVTQRTGGRLWFLFALIYIYAFAWLFHNIIKKHITVLASIGFLEILIVPIWLLVARRYEIRVMGIGVTLDFLYRNWFLFGLPFFLIGAWVKKNEVAISRIRIPNPCLWGILLIGGLVSVVEIFSHHYQMEYLYGSLIILFSIWILSIQCRDAIIPRWLNYVGKNLTLYVYIVHSFVITLLGKIDYRINTNQVYAYFKPILVVIITLIICTAFYEIMSRFRSDNISKKCQTKA